jgi:hypothetical protein
VINFLLLLLWVMLRGINQVILGHKHTHRLITDSNAFLAAAASCAVAAAVAAVAAASDAAPSLDDA